MDYARHRGLEALSDTEKEVEVAGLADVRRRTGIVIEHWIDRWVQVVAEVHTDRTHGCSVTESKAHIVRVVVEVAGTYCGVLRLSGGNGDVPAGLLVGLMEILDAFEHVAHVLERVTHIVEDHEGDAIPHQWKRRRRKPQLERIDDHAGSTNWIACG